MASEVSTVTAAGRVDLSQVTKDDFNPDLVLRVAVIHGDEILGSVVLDRQASPGGIAFQVEFAPPIDAISQLPCPVRIIVGPNVADRDFLALEVAHADFDFTPRAGPPDKERTARKGKTASAATATALPGRIEVGAIVVPPYLYRCWLLCCRTFHIRGRVVCRNWSYNPRTQQWSWCDDPVPGAEVDIFDVDRFLWWYTQGLITTVTTQVDGTFEAIFVWCCTRWRPWFWPVWQIDEEILRRIRELLALRNVVLPPIPPDPDPGMLQRLVADLSAGDQAQMAALARTAPHLARGSDEPMISTSMATLRSVLPASPELEALHVWPWWGWNDCTPDVIFRVRQRCQGQEEIIYSETPGQTRWNIATTLNVTLLANDKACCLPTCRDPECPDCLKLTWVGCSIPIDQIGDATVAGPPDLRGYKGVAAMADEPLFDTLRLRGAIGPDIDYFKVQFSKDGGPWSDLPTPHFGGYSRRYWSASGWSPYIPFAPAPKPLGGGSVTVIMTRHHYEELNPGLPTFFGEVLWDDRDTLFNFASQALPALGDGLYQLRFVGYAADSADDLLPGSERVLRTCGLASHETVFLRIDNDQGAHPALDHVCGGSTVHFCTNEPEAYIRSLVKNEGLPGATAVDVCDIIDLLPTDTLTIHFTATVPPNLRDGHLGGYSMVAEYGAARVFAIGTGPDSEAPGTPCPPPDGPPSVPLAPRGRFKADPPMPAVQVGPTYAQALAQGAPRPHWYGGEYKVTLRGCDFPECCAYEIRLRAWKRTTNGCQTPEWTHWNRYHNTFTVLRRDLCPDICRDVDG